MKYILSVLIVTTSLVSHAHDLLGKVLTLGAVGVVAYEMTRPAPQPTQIVYAQPQPYYPPPAQIQQSPYIEIHQNIQSQPSTEYFETTKNWQEQCQNWKSSFNPVGLIKADCGQMHCQMGTYKYCSSQGDALIRR